MATEQEMSVTQGLAELKLLDKRLQKSMGRTKWTAVTTKTRPVDKERFKLAATSEYQSYMDLVKRRDLIKRRIVISNATTKVKIGEWEGTVAEAIERKNSISYEKDLLANMKQDYTQTSTEFEREQQNLDTRLDRLLQSELGKDVRTNPETIQSITESFRANNKVEMVDPLDLQKKISELEAEIDNFETNVDWVLSEANGRAMIRV